MNHPARILAALGALALHACAAAPDLDDTDRGAEAVLSASGIAAQCAAVNHVRNHDFAAAAAPTVLTTSGPETRDSAAGGWYARNGGAGTTTTEVVDTPEGRMLHVVTNAANSGVLQQLFPEGQGVPVAAAAAYVRVVRGEVGLVLGRTGVGDTGDTVTVQCAVGGIACGDPYDTGLNRHPLERGLASRMPLYTKANGSAPTNQFGALSIGGGAEFYLFRPWVAPCAGVRVLGATTRASGGVQRTCPGRVTVSAELQVVGSGRIPWTLLTPNFEGTSSQRARGVLEVPGPGTYTLRASFSSGNTLAPGSAWFHIDTPNTTTPTSPTAMTEAAALCFRTALRSM